MTATSTLVTGGAGFIGSHVVRGLLDAGHRVRIIDNLSTGFRENLAGVDGEVEFLEADLRDLALASEAVQKALDGAGIRTVIVRAPKLVNIVAG